MPPSDPAAVPPPAWAVNIALEEFDKDRVDLGFVDPLARLLASVRDVAIREAAAVALSADDPYDAIIAILDSPPSGGVPR